METLRYGDCTFRVGERRSISCDCERYGLIRQLDRALGRRSVDTIPSPDTLLGPMTFTYLSPSVFSKSRPVTNTGRSAL